MIRLAYAMTNSLVHCNDPVVEVDVNAVQDRELVGNRKAVSIIEFFIPFKFNPLGFFLVDFLIVHNTILEMDG